MRLLEILVVVGVVCWVARVLRQGGSFDHAWVTLFVGLGLMLSRAWFLLGVLLTAVSFAFLTLPIARAEWARLQRERRDRGGPPPGPHAS